MKAKKLAAFILGGALAVSTCALFAMACDKKDNDTPKDDVPPPATGGEFTLPDIAYTEDTTEYYVVGGSSAGLLSSTNGWNQKGHDFVFEKNEENTDYNEYVIEIDIYEGEEFGIVHDDSWDGQVGWDVVWGANDDDQLLGENDVVLMESAAGGGSVANIHCNVNATFKLTYYTFPSDTSKNLLKIDYVKEIDAWKIYHSMYIISDYDNFGKGKSDINTGIMANNGDGTWSIKVEITEDNIDDAYARRTATGVKSDDGDYIAFQVQNKAANRTEYEGGTTPAEYVYAAADASETPLYVTLTEDKMNLLTYGTYRITYNEKTDSVTIEEAGVSMVIKGSWAVNWGTLADAWQMTERSEGFWIYTVDVTDELLNGAESIACKPLNGYKDVEDWSLVSGSDLTLTKGKWVIWADVNKGTFGACPEGYYLCGSFSHTNWNPTSIYSQMLTADSEGVYTAVFTVDSVTEFQVVYGVPYADNYDWIAKEGGGNAKVEAGTYKVTLHLGASDYITWEAVDAE